MNKLLRTACTLLLVTVAFLTLNNRVARSQSIKILAIDTFNGAMNGALLGGASMALNNSDDYYPVQFGVGMGTLGGMAIGVFDMTKAAKGDNYYVNGVFNEATATTTIMLMDTFYGGVAGALVGTSITLMSNQPIVDGIQYGAGAGLWTGFAFGVVDAFYFSHRVSGLVGQNRQSNNRARGLLTYQPTNDISIGAISPKLYSITSFEHSVPRTQLNTGMNLVNLRLSL